MIELDINKALDGLLNTLAARYGFPVAWENSAFEPGEQPYLKPSFLPATTMSPSVQLKGKVFRGVYQISLIIAIGSGTQAARRSASQIAEGMELALTPNGETGVTGLVIGDGTYEVYTTSPATISAGFNDGYGYNIPITLNYRADT